MLRQRFYQLYDQEHLLHAIECRFRIQAVVASPTVILSIILAKIVQEQLPAALVRLSICDGLYKKLTIDFLLRDWFAMLELFQLLDIFIAIIGDAVRTLSVSTGAASS